MRDYTIRSNLPIEEIKRLNIIHDTYKKQRQNINYDFNKYLINKYCRFSNQDNFWNLFHKLDGIVDLSDPDTSMPNSLHALQTAEAIRATGKYPEWFVLTGLIHDMGKILYLKGCPEDGTSIDTQWSIVGDTFITGCNIPDDIILSEYNNLNKDHNKNNYYYDNIGLSNCEVSFGHDEFMYRLLEANGHKLPIEADYIIRYHSLYAWHSGTSYDYLENNVDKEMKKIVQEFNKFDLYTKNDNNILEWTDELKDYYTRLVTKYISPDLEIIF